MMGNEKRHRGQPSKYNAEVHPKWAASLARRGCTVAEIAEAFGVGVRTVYGWKGAHPEFSHALNESRSEADEKVVTSLYRKACGVTVREKRVIKTKDSTGKDVMREEIVTKELPPDTTAIIYWLKNRQPELWRDKPKNDDTDTAVLKAAKELVSSVQSAIE